MEGGVSPSHKVCSDSQYGKKQVLLHQVPVSLLQCPRSRWSVESLRHRAISGGQNSLIINMGLAKCN